MGRAKSPGIMLKRSKCSLADRGKIKKAEVNDYKILRRQIVMVRLCEL